MASNSRRIPELNADSSQREDLGLQETDGTRDYFDTSNRGASTHLYLDRATLRTEDPMAVRVSGLFGSLASDPIPIDRRNVFSACLDGTFRCSHNTASDINVD